MFDLNETHHNALSSPNATWTDGQLTARANLVKRGYLVLVAGLYQRTPAGAYLLTAYNCGIRD
jgi:hypothetical protein